MNDELLLLANEWPIEQLTEYIKKLEERVKNTRTLIQDLRTIQKSKQRKLSRKNYDNGPRGGM